MAPSSSSDAADLEKRSVPDMFHNEKDPVSKPRQKIGSPHSQDNNEKNDDEEARPGEDRDGIDEGDEDDDEDGSPSFMDRVLSRVTSRSSLEQGPPPDGGWVAWCQCESNTYNPLLLDCLQASIGIAGHLVIMNTWSVYPLLPSYEGSQLTD